MSKLATLRLLNGDLEQGVQVVLTITVLHPLEATASQKFKAEHPVTSTEVTGTLPPNACLEDTIGQWQSNYRSLGSTRIRPNQVIYNASIHQCRVACKKLDRELRSQFNTWLLSDSFRPIRDKWLEQLMQDEIRVLVRTSSQSLLKLPWQLWDLIERNPLAEVALSTPDAEPIPKAKMPTLRGDLKILAILGDSRGIDIKRDRQLLERLVPKPRFLDEPQRREINDQLWEQDWDILFFAGHSRTEGEQGRIYINKTDSLTISELRYALKKAVGRGLQLAIFNSCDGMGLAFELQKLHIPQMIIMREPVPDRVAHTFLTYFLPTFIKNRSLYLAEREARLRLQGLEDEFPCASWLPVIFQNPVEILPQPPLASRWQRSRSALLVSLAITAGVLGIRNFGLLQPLELLAFDQLQRLRPQEQPDSRLLVVAVTEADIQKQKEWPLSDETLAKLLTKLEKYQPRVIGLDIYRDLPVGSEQASLAPHLLNPRLIAVCETSAANKIGIPPPLKIPNDRLGFSDVVVDPDGILRRHLLYITTDSTSPCTANYAFSLQLAYHYLAVEGIQPQEHPKQYLQLGNTVFKPLTTQTGGYRMLDARGHQLLLNYRSSASIAEQVTLSDMLDGRFDPNLVKNRIVLIGVTAASVHDDFSTPYSAEIWPRQKLPGVLVQAQMVSQILSAVLDGRPLLWVWPAWGEILWIWGWSLVGGTISWGLGWRPLLRLGLAVVMLGSLYGFCFVLLLQGGWVPLVPSAFALAISAGSIVVAYTAFQTKRQ